MEEKPKKIELADEWVAIVPKLPGMFRKTRIPVIGKMLYKKSFVGDPTTRAWMVPVGESIDLPQSAHLPFEIIKILIEKSAYRAKMKVCMCREGFNCQHFPHDLGTIFIGSAFKDAEQLGLTQMTKEEALAHAEKAVSLGLAPTLIWEKEIQSLFNMPRNKGLGLCFCCNCCCDYRLGLRVGNEAFHKKVIRPEGVSVVVSDQCNLCGECAKPEVCSASAIRLGATKAVIDLNRCVGCGACIRSCSYKAISYYIDPNVDVVGKLLARVEEYTDVS